MLKSVKIASSLWQYFISRNVNYHVYKNMCGVCMKINSKFDLHTEAKKDKRNSIVSYNTVLQNNQEDKFISNSQVAFKAKAPVGKVADMIKSTSYWKIVGATVAATAAAIWKMLDAAGVDEDSISTEQIQEIVDYTVPTDLAVQTEPEVVVAEEVDEVSTEETEAVAVVEVDEVLTEEPEVVVVEEVENTSKQSQESSKPTQNLKTVRLKGGKQKVESELMRQYHERVEIIKKLADEGLSQSEIARKVGLTDAAISQIISREGILTAKAKRKAEIDSISNEKILETFEENKAKTKEEVSEILGLTVKELDKTCKERGIQKFTKQRLPKVIVEQKAVVVEEKTVLEELKDEAVEEKTALEEQTSVENSKEEVLPKKNSLDNETKPVGIEIRINDVIKGQVAKLEELCSVTLATVKDLEAFTSQFNKEHNCNKSTAEVIYECCLARTYNAYRRQGVEGVNQFISGSEKKRVFAKNYDIISQIKSFSDVSIPKEDPLYEDFKKCVDEEKTMNNIQDRLVNFNDSLYYGIARVGLLESLKNANPNLLINHNVLLNVIENINTDEKLYGTAERPELLNLCAKKDNV